MANRAEQLSITEGPLWIIGHSDEENALLDSVSENIEIVTIDAHTDDEVELEEPRAAIVVVDDPSTLAADLDDALPRIGAVPVVWVALPRTTPDLPVAAVTDAIAEYGWLASKQVQIGSAWTAIRVNPA